MPFKISNAFATIVEKNLEESGISIKTKMLVKEITGKTKVQSVVYGNDEAKETIDAEL